MIKVNVENFVRAENDRMFRDLQALAGGINAFGHHRAPAAIDQQTVIRMNRDTLYSIAIVDLAEGATLVLPDPGERYLSAMVINQDHYIYDVFHGPGTFSLAQERYGSRYVAVGVRILVDPSQEADLATVAALQDQLVLDAASAEPFTPPEYDTASLDATRTSLLALAAGLEGFDHAFGAPGEVDPIRHLLGTAAGWGGLPTSEAVYKGVFPNLPVGTYELTVSDDVPVDGFWSISVYDAEGFFAPNDRNAYSLNNITAVRNDDGSITIRLGDHPADAANVIPLPEGWNYVVRLYRPRPEVVDGTWTFPTFHA